MLPALVAWRSFQSQIVRGSVYQGLHRNKSYDFAADDAYSVAFGFKTYHFECPVDSGFTIVGEIHGYLSDTPILQFHAHGLAIAQSATDKTDFLGNVMRYF